MGGIIYITRKRVEIAVRPLTFREWTSTYNFGENIMLVDEISSIFIIGYMNVIDLKMENLIIIEYENWFS